MLSRCQKIKVLEQIAHFVDGQIKRDYSARGKLKRTCYGIICKDSFDCVARVCVQGIYNAKVGHMGFNHIVYWPDITGEK